MTLFLGVATAWALLLGAHDGVDPARDDLPERHRFVTERALILIGLTIAALGFTLRDSEMLYGVDLLSVLFMGALAVWQGSGRPLRSFDVLDAPRAVILAGLTALVGAPDVLRALLAGRITPEDGTDAGSDAPAHAASTQERARASTRAIAIGLVLALPPLFVVMGLLASADSVFDGVLNRIGDLIAEDGVRHAMVIAGLTWGAMGWLHGTRSMAPVVTLPDVRAPGLPFASIGIGLYGLAALLTLFIGTQLRVLAGGAEYLRATAGLTVAEYAREGFFQLVVVAGVVLFTLIAGEWLLARTERDVRRYRIVGALLSALVALLLASAVARMGLYVAHFGLTTDRIFAIAIMVWVLAAYITFALTMLRHHRARFAPAMLGVTIGWVASLNIIDPEAIVVRTNIARAVEGKPFDAAYHARMSADAIPALVAGAPSLSATDCAALAGALHTEWTTRRTSRSDWRAFNLPLARALATGVGDTRQPLSLCPGDRVAANEPFDLLIVNGTVIDGTNAPGRTADVGIRGDRVVAVAPSLPRTNAARVLDATGRTVAPGFIDLHAHLEPLLQLPLMESALRQGVTFALGGPDGGSPVPLGAYMDSVRAAKPGINVGYLIGHNDVRRTVLGMHARAPTAGELARMQQLVAQGMGVGAFGLSTGLLYLPGTYSNVEEVIALAQTAADSGGIYTSHLRKEGIGLLDGVAEALEIGRRARIPVVLTHHKAVGQQMWGKSVQTLAMVDSARRAGTDVMVDQYPYTATHTGIGVLIPSWAMDGGMPAFRNRVENAALRDSVLRGIVFNLLNDRGGGDLSRVQFSRVAWDRTLEGKTLRDWAERRGMAPTAESGAQLVLEAQLKGGGNAIYHVLDEQDVRRIMVHSQTMIASDGRLSQPGDGHPHPRAYGTFPRVLGEYVRAQQLLPLHTAVHKMTQMPATRLGLTDRGVLRAGAIADVVIFDAATVRDQATFTEPHQYPVGIETVVVNGTIAVENGTPTGARAGRVVTRGTRGR